MRFETFVALRYLVASRRRAHVALIATISVVGLAVGVAALVVSLALLSGFQDRIRRQMMDKSAHLRVSPARGARLRTRARARGARGAAGRRRGRAGDRGAGLGHRTRGLRTPVPVHYRNAAVAPRRRVRARRITGPAGGAPARAGQGEALRLTSSRMRLSPIGPIPVSGACASRRCAARARSTGRRGRGLGGDGAAALRVSSRARRAFEARLARPLEADVGGRRARAAARRGLRSSRPGGS